VQDKVPAAGDMEQELHFGKLFNGFLESIEQFGVCFSSRTCGWPISSINLYYVEIRERNTYFGPMIPRLIGSFFPSVVIKLLT
jgi:hypothetical protein